MSLKEELKISGRFHSIQEEAFLGLVRTHNLLEPQHVAVLKPHGISPAQFNILRILKGADRSEGLSCSDIGARMISRDSDVTRLLDKLVKADFVQRVRPESDRRKVLCLITPKGLALVQRATPQVNRANQNLLGHMNDTDLQTLIAILEKARAPYL